MRFPPGWGGGFQDRTTVNTASSGGPGIVLLGLGVGGTGGGPAATGTVLEKLFHSAHI